MGYRFEFDPVNKILLGRVEGRFTEELAAEFYGAIRKYSVATDAHAGIFDFSSVTQINVSADFVRHLARSEPAMPDVNIHPSFFVAPMTAGFGLARMFQILGEPTRPLLKVVHRVDEALAELGFQSPHFESLE